ncbi:MAG: sigma-70 family RNA polymerase sigma factor [Christensenella sp.]
MLLLVMELHSRQHRNNIELDEGIFTLIANGDNDALAFLYTKTERIMYAYVLSVIKDPHATQDIVSEIYIRIKRAAHLYKPMCKPLAWMFSIAKNLSLDYLRRHPQTNDAVILDDDLRFSCVEDPTERLVLRTAIMSLNEEERKIVMLHVVAGLKHRELATIMKLPLSTVLSKYHRALAKLKTFLTNEGIRL